MRANVLFADDYVHKPVGHLASYRPLCWFDLALWNAVFGEGYLVSVTPKLLAGLWVAGTCCLLMALLRRWGAPPAVSVAVPLIYATHPIVSELSLWNVAAPYSLSILLIVAGFHVLRDATSAWRCATAALLMALGISGYQVHVTLLGILVAAELAVRLLHGEPLEWRVIVRKSVIAAIAVSCYLAYVEFSRSVLGIASWGGRGTASLRTMGEGAFFQAKWKGVTMMLANLFQPALSYYLGMPRAWSWWKWCAPGAAVVTFAAALWRGKGLVRSALLGTSPVLFPLGAAAVLLPLNVEISGWRICGAVWLAFCLALVPALSLIEAGNPRSRWGRAWRPAWIVTALLLSVSVPVIAAAADVRVRAKLYDDAVLEQIQTHWKKMGLAKLDYRIAALPPEAHRQRHVNSGERVVMEDFNPLTPEVYSNWFGFWQAYLEREGFRPLDPEGASADELHRLVGVCGPARVGASVGHRYGLAHLETERVSVVCR